MHFEQSRDLGRATIYLEHAAKNAQHRSAYQEARMHFDHALALVERQPASRERTERELGLRIGWGSVAIATLGWAAPEAEDAYVRAHALCRELGKTPRLFPVLWGLWFFYLGRGRLSTAHELSENLLALGRQSGDEGLLLQAHHTSWTTAFYRGDFEATLTHASAGTKLYETDRHAGMAEMYGSHDAALCAQISLARALAVVGRTREAARTAARPSYWRDIWVTRTRWQSHTSGWQLRTKSAAMLRRRESMRRRQWPSRGSRASGSYSPLRLCSRGGRASSRGAEKRGAPRFGTESPNRARQDSTSLAHSLGLLAEAHLRTQRVDAGLAAIDEALGIARDAPASGIMRRSCIVSMASCCSPVAPPNRCPRPNRPLPGPLPSDRASEQDSSCCAPR